MSIFKTKYRVRKGVDGFVGAPIYILESRKWWQYKWTHIQDFMFYETAWSVCKDYHNRDKSETNFSRLKFGLILILVGNLLQVIALMIKLLCL